MMSVGGKRIYNKVFEKKEVISWDVFPVSGGETVSLTFESKNSEWSQGVWLMCDMGVEIDSLLCKSVMLWYETAPNQVKVKCYTESGLLNVYNIWNRGNGPASQTHTSGMLIEEISKGRRYRCNDIGLQTDFDKLVFKIEYLF